MEVCGKLCIVLCSIRTMCRKENKWIACKRKNVLSTCRHASICIVYLNIESNAETNLEMTHFLVLVGFLDPLRSMMQMMQMYEVEGKPFTLSLKVSLST
jgi:hypothetical protein